MTDLERIIALAEAWEKHPFHADGEINQSIIAERIRFEAAANPATVKAMAERIMRLEEALRWYGDELSYVTTQMKEPRSAVHGDGGKRAREALEGKPSIPATIE